MRDLGERKAAAPFELLYHRHLLQHALSEFIDALCQHRDLIVPSYSDLLCQVSALKNMDLLVDQMDILDLFADP